jgi:hypothetical protein
MPSPSDLSTLASGRRTARSVGRRRMALGLLPLRGVLVLPSSLAVQPQAEAASDSGVSTLGVRFREVKQQQYRGCVLNFRALQKSPPDLPDASLIVDGSLAYALPEGNEPPRIGLSVIFSKEFKRSMTPMPAVEIAYLQTSNGSTGESIAERVPNTPTSVSSFAFGVDPSSGHVVQDLRNGEGFTLMYRLQPGGEIRALPIDTGIADSTFSAGRLIRYPSPRAMRGFADCIDKLTAVGALRTEQAARAAAAPPVEETSHGSAFARWLRQYAPFPLARANTGQR